MMTTETTIGKIKGHYAKLRVFVDESYPKCEELRDLYREHIRQHNAKILVGCDMHDAGFDLLVPEEPANVDNKLYKHNTFVRCSMEYCDEERNKVYFTGYYMYPRSSISKTNLRLANGTGIIDAGYRGNLIGVFDVINENPLELGGKKIRLLQICAPTLAPIYVELVDNVSELSGATTRGDGGFGSTGGTL